MSRIRLKQIVALFLIMLIASPVLAQNRRRLRLRRWQLSDKLNRASECSNLKACGTKHANDLPVWFRPRARRRGGRGMGMGGGFGMGAGFGMPDILRDIHVLLTNHDSIQRQVTEVPGGVVTTTTSTDPDLTELLRRHVRQMQSRLESGRPIRMWDRSLSSCTAIVSRFTSRLKTSAEACGCWRPPRIRP